MQAEAISYLRAEPGRIALLPTLLDNSPYSVMECIALQVRTSKSSVVSEADSDSGYLRRFLCWPRMSVESVNLFTPMTNLMCSFGLNLNHWRID